MIDLPSEQAKMRERMQSEKFEPQSVRKTLVAQPPRKPVESVRCKSGCYLDCPDMHCKCRCHKLDGENQGIQ